jgi:hypothetical protein
MTTGAGKAAHNDLVSAELARSDGQLDKETLMFFNSGCCVKILPRLEFDGADLKRVR